MELMSGLGLSGYRSFAYDHMQYVAPMSKVNLIAGQNNAGKSNLLRFVEGLPLAVPGTPPTNGLSGSLDTPVGSSPGGGQPKVALATSRETLSLAVERASVDRSGHRYTGEAGDLLELLPRVLAGPADLLWIPYTLSKSDFVVDA
ncbi:MAG: hypothetical protein LCH76_15750 [Actinobacteria bacterium]|nr:hypothetical protein [Actinomycetota bacterium]